MTDEKNVVRLLVNGSEYQGWKSVRIEAGIERQARSFTLDVTDRWPGQTDVPRQIQPGDTCQIYIGTDLVLTGYVDATPIKYDGKQITVGVAGRSKTADLVDCCPVVKTGKSGKSSNGGKWGDVIGKDGKEPKIKPTKAAGGGGGQWHNQKLEVIAAALAAPYSVKVYAEVDTGRPIPEFQIQQGETIFESIDRMMRLRHVLSTDNERGDLVFIDVGSSGHAGTALELGKNIREGSAGLDYKAVFSDYICKGQRSGNDEEYGENITEEEASSTDSRAKRKRVLVLKQSGQADEGTCQDRVDYERAHRAAKALETNYTVAGWRQENGDLWLPNQIVRVRDPIIGFDIDMVIAEISWTLDSEGMRSELRVGPPDGYRTKAAKGKKGKGKGAGKGGSKNWGDLE